jgi:hypothetical protein
VTAFNRTSNTIEVTKVLLQFLSQDEKVVDTGKYECSEGCRTILKDGSADFGPFRGPTGSDRFSLDIYYNASNKSLSSPTISTIQPDLDPNFIGIWKTTVSVNGSNLQLTLDIRPDGSYKTNSSSFDSGKFEAQEGKWRWVSGTGQVVEGQYKPVDSNHISITGPLGTALWILNQHYDTSGTDLDPLIVGDWSFSTSLNGSDTKFDLDISPSGAYKFSTLTVDSGKFQGHAGNWSYFPDHGLKVTGTYEFIDRNSVSMTGPLGTATWVRQLQ